MRFLPALFLSAVLFAAGSLHAQGRRSSSRRAAIPEIQLSVSLVSAPSIQVLDKADAGIPLGKSKKWIQFLVAYKFSSSAVNARKIYEDMKIELYVRHPAPDGYAWITGEQYLHCVMADMEKHYAALYMPPSTVARYISRERKSRDVLKNLQGIVILSDRDDQILGLQFFDLSAGGKKLSSSQTAALRNAFRNINQEKYKFVDAIWPKENTPWQWIDAEKYDLPKPVFQNIRKTQIKEVPAEKSAGDESGE